MQLYNSLTQKKETFTPIHKDNVGMYVCGITPYDTTHLGHAFTYTFFDTLLRYLTIQGYNVTYVQNVTDIDDDILRKAKEVNRDWQELGEWWTNKFVTDMQTLQILPPAYYVKATDTIEMIIEIIKVLQEKNLAYEKAGTVYFRTKNDETYGKLSGYSREEMIRLSKERGANPDDPQKEDALDFILWQKSLPDEPFWKSPWGKGRPGWHIECSAMAYKYIDKKLDIHGGGSDLIYPHHESEIAQSEAFTGEKPFVKYWLHTGAVGYEGEKMSKSLGNLVLVSDLLKAYSPNVIRYLLLSHHYREPWEFKHEQLKSATQAMAQITSALEKQVTTNIEENETIIKAFTNALDDDMDTPKALEILGASAKQIHSQPTIHKQKQLREMVKTLGFIEE